MFFWLSGTVYADICSDLKESCSPGGAYTKYDCSGWGIYCRNYATDDSYDQCSAWSGDGSGCTALANHLYRVYRHKFNCTNSCLWDAYACTDLGKVCGNCGVPSSTPSCPTTCHTNTTYPSNDCGTSTCGSNAPAYVSCPTDCHTDTQNKSDGACSTHSCGSNAPADFDCNSLGCHTNNVTGKSNGSCGTKTCYANPPAAQNCPSTCHATAVSVPNGSCGTTNCPANNSSFPAGSCPTTCHTNTQYVPDGSCGNTTCSPNNSSYPAGSCLTCGVTAAYNVADGSCNPYGKICNLTVPCTPTSASTPNASYSCFNGVTPQIIVSWDNILSATIYWLKRTDDLGVSKVLSSNIPAAAGSQTSYTDQDPDITVGRVYKYQMWPGNAQGWSPDGSALSPLQPAIACDTRAPENLTLPNSAVSPVGLNNRCFDKSGGINDWDQFAKIRSDGLGGIQTWASDNIGVTSLNFRVTRNEGGTILSFPAEENLGPPTTVEYGPSLIDGVQVRRSQWKASIPFAGLGVGNYSIVAEASDLAGNKTTSDAVNFVLNDPCVDPWIQTVGGDVHSNTRINTPGGP